MKNADNFREFFEALKDMIVVGNEKGDVIYVNNYLKERLGYTLEEVKKKGILGLNPKDKQKEAKKIFEEMNSGVRDYCPLPVEAKDGTLIPVETRVFKGKWDGKDCIFGIVKDLTLQQAALQRFEKIFENNPMPMAISSMVTRKFIEVNRAFLELLKYKKTEIIGHSSEDLQIFVNPKEQDLVASQLSLKGNVRDVELTLRDKNGNILVGLFSGEIVEIQNEKAFLTTMIDITNRKESEEQMQKLNSIMTGREVRMIELKNRISELEHKLSKK